jgi:hypothetical protein
MRTYHNSTIFMSCTYICAVRLNIDVKIRKVSHGVHQISG